ncbi:thioredoxin reductase [Candidatus Riesia sp. GBBU]|nr:thioredoxin reductase [Candidatus Riesia sp. GBBU]
MKKFFYRKSIILGSGPAGCTSAIYLARANLNPILITGNYKGGQLTSSYSIENWPGESFKISGKELMQKMLKHVKMFLKSENMIDDHINKVDFLNKPFKLFGLNNNYACDSLIISTGSSNRYLEVPNEKKFIGNGISTCATCDGFIYRNKIVAVIGGGNSAIEESLFLSKIAKEVHIIHRRKEFRAEKVLIKRLEREKENKKIFFHKNFIVRSFSGKSVIHSINLISSDGKTEKKISIDGVFIAIGKIPNTKIFSKQISLKHGYIITNKENDLNKTQTSIDGIFAAGDVADSEYRQAITAAGFGCMAAIDLIRYLENTNT